MLIIKTYLFLLLVLAGTCKNQNINRNCDDIKQYLKLEVEINQDTVCFEDELEINVLFRNKTDSCLYFYPKAAIFLVKSFSGLGCDNYFIHKFLDATKPQKIEPKSIYQDTYNIIIRKSFFKEGINTLRLGYTCKELGGDAETYNKLCGSLVSSEFILTVLKKSDI